MGNASSSNNEAGADEPKKNCPKKYVGVWKQTEFDFRKLLNLVEVAWAHLKADGTCEYFYYESYTLNELDHQSAEQLTGAWKVVDVAGTLYMDLDLSSGKKYHFHIVKDPQVIEMRMEKTDVSVEDMQKEIEKYQALANKGKK